MHHSLLSMLAGAEAACACATACVPLCVCVYTHLYVCAGKGVIKGVDFANSLVTAADIKVVDGYLDKVSEARQRV